ncbi:bifunctional dethiobiotin synthetase/adenosylmethionine-8-amino-7-oxononanoate aminotransferase [Zopfia rhizophila CBS 207.26]|uniref:Bifunctional dethiobiotin synthetase/adenosylmethionine-8-amino-7-oxononanoate aminotransferase n=1 Tax=Zopfia rhizophila CBS 207.26 TaxID=1314779 RepID=A0A6A6EE04_9PEZI|nr:bifunctional dethiobiotin synthetase/adenosylmethionine-8-amino-7-oxononanoate aminotransferase [Zopfia rhizophila CBS 207.26]
MRVPSGLWKNLVPVQIYGANTGVGKTVVSTLLAKHFPGRKAGKTRWSVKYLKPVSTGPAGESDERYVKRHAGCQVRCLYRYDDPVSPHLAARNAGEMVSDETLLSRISKSLRQYARSEPFGADKRAIVLIETAGGVLSPGPQSTPQADLYRPLRLPVVLVGDYRLGGIATTISAFESLTLRGYDVDAIAIFNSGRFGNDEYLKSYFKNQGNIPVFSLPSVPDLEDCSKEEEWKKMEEYYENVHLSPELSVLAGCIVGQNRKRLQELNKMAKRTNEVIWHPFTQHKSIEQPHDILVFDSAYGDYFQTLHTRKSLKDIKHEDELPVLYPAFDGSASWWTQGLGHGNPELSLAAAYAAGRYGHVMFAGATHQPALLLADRLLKGLENPRLKKVFFTDNGSTGTEVGIKMALRAACKRYEWDGSAEEIGIIGLKGSYHGDTLGAMEASEPSIFNKKVDWYRGRGYWFDYPQVKMRRGRWVVEPPVGMEEEFGPRQYFESLDEIFDFETRGSSPRYEQYIEDVLNRLTKSEGKKFGALVMEPVLLGAGGMVFVDPLFQRSLINVIRRYSFSSHQTDSSDPHTWTGLPVLFDEVFTGLYRLGRFSSASFLSIHPDISVHAKLLTGGLLPLCTTVASQSVFDAFWGDKKADALLHGHSYTAHPIGCHVANTSLEVMKGLEVSSIWERYRRSWMGETRKEEGKFRMLKGERKEEWIWSMWNKHFVEEVSKNKRVDACVALGSVLAISLVDKKGAGVLGFHFRFSLPCF